MKQPLVSFVIPTKNRAYCISSAIRSCLEQKMQDIEVIIVDDGSTDYTKKLVDKFINKELADDALNKKVKDKIRYFKMDSKAGCSAARNMGNRLARGKYICILDSDDWAEPKRATWVARHFEKNKSTQFVYGMAQYSYVNGEPVYASKPFDKESLKEDNYIVNSTVAYTKDLAMKYRYNEKMDCIEDYDLLLRLAKDKVEMGYIKKVLSHLTLSSDGLTPILRKDTGYEKKKANLKKKYKNI